MFNKKVIYDFAMKESDVTTFMSVVSKVTDNRTFRCGNCGWAKEPDMWFVIFQTSKKNYKEIEKELYKIGTIGEDEYRKYFKRNA